MLFFVLEQHRTHHRRQGQGDKAGNQHGAGQGQGEFDEELAGATGHEGDRRVNRGQRQGHGDHGKADFLRPQQGGLHARHALFDVTVNIFEDDNGVIHHQTDGQHEGQQGQRVDGEAQHEHDGEGADQRHRNGDQRNQGRPQVAQEEEDDGEHEQNGFADGLENGLDGAVDEDRRIVGNIGAHAIRQLLDQVRQLGAQRFRQFERVGGGLLDDADADRRTPVETHRTAFRRRPDFDAAEIGDAHRVGIDRLDDDFAELFRRLQIGGRHH